MLVSARDDVGVLYQGRPTDSEVMFKAITQKLKPSEEDSLENEREGERESGKETLGTSELKRVINQI